MNTFHSPKFKNQKTAFYILLTYIFVFQLSGLIFSIPIIREFSLNLIADVPLKQQGAVLASWWTFIVGILSFVIIGILMFQNKEFFKIYKGEKATTMQAIGWGFIGFFLVFFSQSIAAAIEIAIGIKPGSENTATLVDIAEIAPIMIVSIAIIGPTLEEIIFRRVVFGSLVQVQGFWISAIVSGIVFAAVHLEFSHILIYTVSGLVFAFIYHKTKRLLASIVAHILLNSYVVTINFYSEEIQRYFDSLFK